MTYPLGKGDWSAQLNTFDKILIVGCGNMGGAMLAGWLAGGIAPGRFTVVDPLLAEAPEGVKLLRALPEGTFDAILLGVKPQLLGDVAPLLAPLLTGDTVLLSILAGAELASLAALFPPARRDSADHAQSRCCRWQVADSHGSTRPGWGADCADYRADAAARHA